MKKILLVDDEQDILDSLGNILRRNNYEVVTTSKGADVLELARSTKPDLLILDVLMPDKDGTEVAIDLENDPTTKDIPVMFLTGMMAKEEELPENKTNKMHYSVAKPVEKEELLNLITQVIA